MFLISEQGMNSLSLQLDTKLNDMKDIEVVRSELLDTRNKNQYLEAQVKSLGEDLEKLKSENKVLLKHDQVCVYEHLYSFISVLQFLLHPSFLL